MPTSALTFNIQRFSTEDGPGIRTTVFFKGCPLHCPWCHNPEGLRQQLDLVWYDVRCIGARECVRACPEQALSLHPDGLHIERAECTPVSYTHLRAHETVLELVCRLLLEKKNTP